MGKKRTIIDKKTKKKYIIDEDECFIFTHDELEKAGKFGKEQQYKYFCEHPEEIEDQKLFSELEKEFGGKNDNI